jgi:SOS-response transcriptional repressor LexA
MFALSVKGTSMQPFLFNGDSVLVRPCSPGELKPGDIVAVALAGTGGMICVHRLVRKSTERRTHADLIIKGDDISRIEKVRIDSKSRLFGKVVRIVRGDKYISTENRLVGLFRLIYSLAFIPYQVVRGH